jgi:hypothetical protein
MNLLVLILCVAQFTRKQKGKRPRMVAGASCLPISSVANRVG